MSASWVPINNSSDVKIWTYTSSDEETPNSHYSTSICGTESASEARGTSPASFMKQLEDASATLVPTFSPPAQLSPGLSHVPSPPPLSGSGYGLATQLSSIELDDAFSVGDSQFSSSGYEDDESVRVENSSSVLASSSPPALPLLNSSHFISSPSNSPPLNSSPPRSSSPLNSSAPFCRVNFTSDTEIIRLCAASDTDDSALRRLEDADDDSSMVVSSPCLPRSTNKLPHFTGKQSSYFGDRKPGNQLIPRPSWLKTRPKDGRQKQALSGRNQPAAEKRRKPEYHPRHHWTDEDRTLLCVLFRFYERSPDHFAAVYNSVTGYDLPKKKIMQQFDYHIRLHGGKAFPLFERVFVTPLHDPDGLYSDLRDRIEWTARSLGIKLRSLKRDTTRISTKGKAAMARAPRTRLLNKKLTRNAREQRQTGKIEVHRGRGFSSADIRSFGGLAIASPQPYEQIVDDEDYARAGSISPYVASAPLIECDKTADSMPSPFEHTSLSTQEIASEIPALGFRVWDDSSQTKFDPLQGFIATIFFDRPNPVTEPLPHNDVHGIFDFLANLHLSKTFANIRQSRDGETELHCGSAFVSVATSFIQVLNACASHMTAPFLALIDLHHPCLAEAHKTQHVKSIIKDLRSKGKMHDTRYRGEQEYIVWGNIPTEAVISIISLADLEDLAADFLCFDLFKTKMRTPDRARSIRAHNRVLDRVSATLMGKIVRICGSNHSNGRLKRSHIADFVACLVDGWSIRGQPTEDIGKAFAKALSHPSIINEAVMQAFAEGVERGLENLARFTGGRKKVIARKSRSHFG